MGIDEVEALAHEGFFVVEDHAGEVDERLSGSTKRRMGGAVLAARAEPRVVGRRTVAEDRGEIARRRRRGRARGAGCRSVME